MKDAWETMFHDDDENTTNTSTSVNSARQALLAGMHVEALTTFASSRATASKVGFIKGFESPASFFGDWPTIYYSLLTEPRESSLCCNLPVSGHHQYAGLGQ